MTSVHRHTNFVVADISHLTIFKMAAIRHLGFLNIWFFEQLLRYGELMCVIMQNVIKIGQTVLEISRFLDFQDGRSSVFKFFKFLIAHQIGRAKMHCRTKFHQIGQTAAEISHLPF